MNNKGQEGMWAIFAMGVVFCVAMGFFTLTTSVPAGNIGIQDTFGNVSSDALNPGFYLKAPWTAIIPMSTKTIELKEETEVPTNEGLIVGLHTSILYHIQSDKATQIYKTVGTNYPEVVITPTLRSAIREITSKYEAKALYSTKRDFLADEIQQSITTTLAIRGIIVEKILLRDLIIPDVVKNAIEQKLQAEQQAQQMQFVLEKETKEAERKIIEAGGIRDSQAIINNTLSERYLQYLWISKLNENPNIIYVPIDSQGLTLFRNVDSIPNPNPIIKDTNN